MTEMTALNTDFDLMHTVAGQIDSRNEELQGMLGSFIGRMSSIPPAVWGGAAAVRFREVVDQWNTESAALQTALGRIAETIRANERTLRDAAGSHAQQIAGVSRTQ